MSCKNTEIIKKLAPFLVNTLHIYFDDIFDCFIDEILEKEVI